MKSKEKKRLKASSFLIKYWLNNTRSERLSPAVEKANGRIQNGLGPKGFCSSWEEGPRLRKAQASTERNMCEAHSSWAWRRIPFELNKPHEGGEDSFQSAREWGGRGLGAELHICPGDGKDGLGKGGGGAVIGWTATVQYGWHFIHHLHPSCIGRALWANKI